MRGRCIEKVSNDFRRSFGVRMLQRQIASPDDSRLRLLFHPTPQPGLNLRPASMLRQRRHRPSIHKRTRERRTKRGVRGGMVEDGSPFTTALILRLVVKVGQRREL